MKGQQLLPYILRPMEREDTPEVKATEEEAFPSLWPTSFKRELSNPLARYLVVARREEEAPPPTAPSSTSQPWHKRLIQKVRSALGMEAPPDPPSQTIAGFIGIWFMVEEAHIVSVAVREAERGKGLGELLLIGAMELAIARGCRAATLEVRVSNIPAISLYEKYGLMRVGLRKKYYTDNREDAHIMTADNILSPDYLERFRRLVTAFQERRGEAARIIG